MANNIDPVELSRKLGESHTGPLDLDNAVPFDIYELFERVTYRYYDHESEEDEHLILDVANAYEEAAWAKNRNEEK